MFGCGSEPWWFLALGSAHLFLPGMVLGMEWWLAASGGHGSGRPLMVLVPADGVWLLMEMQRGKVGCRIGCRPEDYEGWVKTRLWPWPEPVTVASVDAVTFLKASTGCSLFLCEGQLRGKLQTRESVIGGVLTSFPS